MNETLSLNQIITNAGTQSRVGIDEAVVVEYYDLLQEGKNFPPIEVFKHGSKCYLVDGFHRLEAHRRAEYESIEAFVMEGDLQDAIKYSLGVNAAHGLRRSNADKRNAIKTALENDVLGSLSLREIADICKVSKDSVRRVRQSLMPVEDVPFIDPQPTTLIATPEEPPESLFDEPDVDASGSDHPLMSTPAVKQDPPKCEQCREYLKQIDKLKTQLSETHYDGELPDELDTQDFREVFSLYVEARKKLKWPTTPRVLKRLVNKCLDRPLEASIRELELAATRGWRDIFYDNNDEHHGEDAPYEATPEQLAVIQQLHNNQ